MKQVIILPKDGSKTALVVKVLQSLPTDKVWQVTIEERRLRRTDQQNKYLWSIYEMIGASIGYRGEEEKKELHRMLLKRYFGSKTVTMMGQEIELPIRTSSGLSKAEFSDYVEFIQQFCAEHGIFIPDPET